MGQANSIINKFGTMTGWNSITANMMFRDLEAFSSLAYDDTIPKKNAYGGGRYPVGREEGNYEAKFKFSLYKEEADLLSASIPPGKRFQDIAPFDFVVEYERKDGTITKDIIYNCEFTNRGVDVKQGDGSIVTEYEMIVSHIDWDV